MNQQITRGIVLTRLNYGESNRIITVLTPNHGKLRLMAKGVRKIKSKLAGGIELFSTLEASFIVGRGEIGTLVSARLDHFYSNIMRDIDRVQLGYEILKVINKNTEDNAESDYFVLLETALKRLDDKNIRLSIIRLWFESQMLKLAGHEPNFASDEEGKPLDKDLSYSFNLEQMCFSPKVDGRFDQRHIKYARLLFERIEDGRIFGISDPEKIEAELGPTLDAMFRSYLSL